MKKPSESRQAGGASLTPGASQEFERLFLGWLDQNQDQLDAAGHGDFIALRDECLRWAARLPLTTT